MVQGPEKGLYKLNYNISYFAIKQYVKSAVHRVYLRMANLVKIYTDITTYGHRSAMNVISWKIMRCQMPEIC